MAKPRQTIASICLSCCISLGFPGLAPSHARAEADDSVRACTQAVVTPDDTIASCSAVIDSGNLSGRPLAAAYSQRGYARTLRRSLAEAETDLDQAIEIDPDYAEAYCNLGTAYFAEDKMKKGIKMYQKAFSIDEAVFDPDQSKMVEGGGSREQRIAINYYIAETFASAGKQEQALLFLRKAMDEGFNDRKRLDEDKDFAVLRTTPQFQKLLQQENLN